MGRVANFVAAFATLNIILSSAVSAQDGWRTQLSRIVDLAGEANVYVNAALGVYQTVRVLADKQGIEPPPAIVDDDLERERRALARHQELARRMDRLNDQMLVLERRLIETHDTLYDIDQMQLYRSAYAAATSSFDLVEDYFETPRDARSQLDDEVLQQLIRVVEQASGQTIAPPDRLGVHYVAALNVTSLALTNLRSIYASDSQALPTRFRNRLESALTHLDRTTEMALAETGMLSTVSSREMNAYRTRLASLSEHRNVAQLVSGTRFREGSGQACYQLELTRDCRGDECGNMLEQAQRIGQPPLQVTTGYRQLRYAFSLERETVGNTSGGSDFNMMKGLVPTEAAQVTTSSRRDENCQTSGSPEQAWLRAARTYNEALLEAAPRGERASTALAGLALARATRENVADLRTRL